MRDEFYEFPSLYYNTTSDARTAVALYAPMGHADVTSGVALTLSRTAPWVRAVVHRLASLRRARRNWDSYDGLPLKPSARIKTVETIRALEHDDLPVPSVVLNSAGTVGLEWERSGRELEISIGERDELSYVTCDPEGNINEGLTDRYADELKELVGWFLTGAR